MSSRSFNIAAIDLNGTATRAEGQQAGKLMHWLLDPDDWFGRRPWACFAMIAFLIVLMHSI